MPAAQTPSEVSRSNSVATSDYDALPPVRGAQGNPPLTEFGGMGDDMADDVPAEVRQATASIPQTGVLFNLAPFEQIAQLHAAGQKDEARKVYDSLNEQAKYVYKNARNMERFTAQEGARLADEFRQNQDRSAMAAQSPQTMAMEENRLADAKKTMQRADNMIFLMDNLRGGPRGEVGENAEASGDQKSKGVIPGHEKWRSRVGSIQGRWPSMISTEETLGWNADFSSLKGAINLSEAQANKGQGNLSDGERILMAQAASLGLEQARDEPGFEAAFERMYDMALEARQSSEQKMSGKVAGASSVTPTAPAAAPAPQEGFQFGKPYKDAKGNQRFYRGISKDGKPLFSTQ